MDEHQYLDQMAALLPGIEARVDDTEQLRRIPDATIKELRDSGLMKALQPARWGGAELDPIVAYRAARMLGSVCGSTGWVYGILVVHPWHLALFPEQAQEEVWGDDDRELIASTYAPLGQVQKVEGGFRLSGHWPWSSGTDHCKWVFLGGVEQGDPARPDMRAFLLPRSDYRIEDTWHAEGLRGTGPNDIVVEDAFVPEYRTLSYVDTSALDCPGNRLNTAPIYRLPFGSVFPLTIHAAALGIAFGMLDAYRDSVAERIKLAYGEAARDDPYSQIHLAQFSSTLDAAWLQMERNIGVLTERVKRGEALGVVDRARLRHDQVYGLARVLEVADQCFSASGGNAIRRGHPLQRFWRDLHGARQHAINEYELGAVLYGKALLGLEIDGPMF